MSVNFGNGVDYNTLLETKNGVNAQNPYQQNPNNLGRLKYEKDSYSFSKANKCTDGKNDGKIGLLSATGNALLGAGKTVVNGIKGMFTNKKGKFSLGKTLLSAGTIAACIAFPPVGVAACIIGGTMGAVQIGKGIFNATKAKTDGEAKQAWQNIGGGAFSVAASVVGAKSGVKAVKATSSAGGAKGVSALSQLDDAATIGQKVSAFGKDMISSTKNQYKDISSSVTSYAKNLKNTRSDYKKSQAEYNQAGKAYDSAKKNGWTEETYQAADDLKFAQDKLTAAESNYKFSKLENKITNTTKKLRNNSANILEAFKHPVKTIKSLVQSQTGTKVINAIKHPIQTVKNLAQTETGTKFINATKHPIKTTQQTWTALKSKLSITQLKNIGSKLNGQAKNIYAELINDNNTYAQVVQKYGYENVLEVIKLVSGATLTTKQL